MIELPDNNSANINRVSTISAQASLNNRFPWKLFLRLPPDAQLLCTGRHLHTLSSDLATSARHVFAIASDRKELEVADDYFSTHNCRNNVTLLLKRDAYHLPVPDKSIDCLVLNGAFPYQFARPNTDAHESRFGIWKLLKCILDDLAYRKMGQQQAHVLDEARRVLKANGQIILVAKNRFDYSFFRSERDPHSGLWYTSLLPRLIAKIYCALAKHRLYRPNTHSLRGYQRLLAHNGYGINELWGLMPDAQDPRNLIPFDVQHRVWEMPQTTGLDRIRRHRHFVPVYAFSACAALPTEQTVLERLLTDIETKLGTEADVTVLEEFHVTSKNKGIIMARLGKYPIVIKVSFDQVADKGNQINYDFLAGTAGADSLRGLAPQTVTRGIVRNVHYYAETRVKGVLLENELTADNHGSYLAATSRALQALTPHLEDQTSEALTGDVYDCLVSSPLKQIGEALDETELLNKVDRCFMDCFQGLNIRRGLVHGDFCANNIYVRDFEVCGIVDWEDFMVDGLPVLDALNYLHATHRKFHTARKTVDILGRMGQWHSLNAHERQFLEAHYTRCGIDPNCHLPFVYLYWAWHIVGQLGGRLAQDPRSREKRITCVFRQFVARAHSNN